MAGFFETHRETLMTALETARTRAFWSAYPEVPSGKLYGESAAADGQRAFDARCGRSFELPGHPQAGRVGSERSPYGQALNIDYPAAGPGALTAAARRAAPAWARAGIEARVGVCLEMLHRLNRRSFEIGHAVMHTTGQAFVMAFQAGGPHAQDRGLEATAYAYAAMTAIPAQARWSKPQGRREPIVLDKAYRILPRGVALTIGCSTFPTWNAYPGLFASLACGNPVIVKPHPAAILPLAITVEVGRAVLAEAGFDPDVLLLAAEGPQDRLAADLAVDPAVAIVDYTGSSRFGRWLRDNARQAQVYTEEAGINAIAITGTDDFAGMCANIAFSLSLYSGQMCTAPQNLFVPRDGIDTDRGHLPFDAVAEGIRTAVDALLADPERAAGVCGALAGEDTLARVRDAAALGRIVRPSAPLSGLPMARTASPLILAVDAADGDAYLSERFGPISMLIACDDADAAIDLAAGSAADHGAITAAVYAREARLLDRAADAFSAAGVNLSCNLTGGIYVNQSAAFSDFHGTGANPAGNASLTDTAFVAGRFRVSAIRRPAAGTH